MELIRGQIWSEMTTNLQGLERLQLSTFQAKLIIIFSTRSLKKIATLRGHPREVRFQLKNPRFQHFFPDFESGGFYGL